MVTPTICRVNDLLEKGHVTWSANPVNLIAFKSSSDDSLIEWIRNSISAIYRIFPCGIRWRSTRKKITVNTPGFRLNLSAIEFFYLQLCVNIRRQFHDRLVRKLSGRCARSWRQAKIIPSVIFGGRSGRTFSHSVSLWWSFVWKWNVFFSSRCGGRAIFQNPRLPHRARIRPL